MTAPTPAPLPALALDVGQARIGLAVCDERGRFVFGRGYITRVKQAQDVQAVLEAMSRENARTLVVGLPRRTDGADSAQTQRVRAFAQALATAGQSSVFADERFSTRLATQALREGASRAKRREKGLTDEASAITILQTFLDRRAAQGA